MTQDWKLGRAEALYDVTSELGEYCVKHHLDYKTHKLMGRPLKKRDCRECMDELIKKWTAEAYHG
ncbi:MAG: hypothetical protein WC365_03665 [Candidatus Babeliales bacterium]|jgi:hypothetical protein